MMEELESLAESNGDFLVLQKLDGFLAGAAGGIMIDSHSDETPRRLGIDKSLKKFRMGQREHRNKDRAFRLIELLDQIIQRLDIGKQPESARLFFNGKSK